jgi:hypothetical protein
MALSQIVKIRYADGSEVALVDWTDRPLYSTIEILHGTTSQEMNLFQYTVGDSVPAFAPVPVIGQRSATEADTNLAAPGSQASTEEFLCYAIRPEVFMLSLEAATGPDGPDFNLVEPFECGNFTGPLPSIAMLAVMNIELMLQMEISKKLYSQAGFGYYNFGAGVLGYAGVVAAPAVGNPNTFGNRGWPGQEAVRSFAIPAHLGGTEKFRVYVSNPAGHPLQLGVLDTCFSETNDDIITRFARVRIYLDGLSKRPTS